ncbi:MAG: carboxypeptidase-like regulatory domain-containing protein [Gemmatimonadaceae bacterium]
MTTPCQRRWAIAISCGFIASFAAHSIALAQATGIVRGTVVDSSGGEPVPGVSVVVVGSRVGAITDANGKYIMRGAPVGAQTLRLTRIGISPQTRMVTITTGGEVVADFVVGRGVVQLQQVVTTVTGAQRTVELGHAVSMIAADSVFMTLPVRDISHMLNARVTGAQVNSQNGLTGTVSPIRIRGLNSFTVGNDPLVIVDGARIEATPSQNTSSAGRLGDLNMYEIESMDVVKGPAAATLYGTDAANGVIVIRTKRGQAGRTRWNLFAEGGTIRLDTKSMYVPSYAWGHSPNGAIRGCHLIAVATGLCVRDSITTYSPLKDRMNTPIAPGNRGQYGAQVSGGLGSFRYHASGALENEVGYLRMPLNDQKRIAAERGGAAIPDEQLRPNALRKGNVRVNLSTGIGSRGDFTFSNGVILQDFRAASTEPFRAGYWGIGYDHPISHGYGFGDRIGDFFAVRDREELMRYIGSLSGSYRPTNWLSTRSTLGFDFSNNVSDDLQKYEEGPPGANRIGRRSQADNNIAQYSYDIGATAELPVRWVRGLTSRTSIGAQYNRRTRLQTLATGVGLPPGSVTLAGAATVTASEIHEESIVVGSYVEQQFGWRDRLFATVALRSDGASTFGKDLRTTVYPKFGLSWLASEEAFFPKIPGVTSLRFRAGMGGSGVQPPSTAGISVVTLRNAAINGVAVSASEPGSLIGNPAVRPERLVETEAGFDLDAMAGRVKAEVTAYWKKSSDALVQSPFAASVGGGTQYTNIGSVSNKGLEGLVSARLVDRALVAFDLTLNGSTNKNKLLTVGPNAPPGFFANFTFHGARHRVGYPLFGNWQRPILSYVDTNNDGLLAPSEVAVGDTDVYIAPGLPEHQMSATGTLSLWRDRVSVTSLFDWRGGYKRYDYTAGVGCTLLFNCFAANDPRASLKEQAAVVAKSKTNTNIGFYAPGSYTRLRELSVNVRLPRRLYRGAGAQEGSLSLSGRNLWIWSAFTGADPEVNGAGTGGDLVNTFPTPPLARYWIARLNLSY